MKVTMIIIIAGTLASIPANFFSAVLEAPCPARDMVKHYKFDCFKHMNASGSPAFRIDSYFKPTSEKRQIYWVPAPKEKMSEKQ